MYKIINKIQFDINIKYIIGANDKLLLLGYKNIYTDEILQILYLYVLDISNYNIIRKIQIPEHVQNIIQILYNRNHVLIWYKILYWNQPCIDCAYIVNLNSGESLTDIKKIGIKNRVKKIIFWNEFIIAQTFNKIHIYIKYKLYKTIIIYSELYYPIRLYNNVLIYKNDNFICNRYIYDLDIERHVNPYIHSRGRIARTYLIRKYGIYIHIYKRYIWLYKFHKKYMKYLNTIITKSNISLIEDYEIITVESYRVIILKILCQKIYYYVHYNINRNKYNIYKYPIYKTTKYILYNKSGQIKNLKGKILFKINHITDINLLYKNLLYVCVSKFIYIYQKTYPDVRSYYKHEYIPNNIKHNIKMWIWVARRYNINIDIMNYLCQYL